MTVKYDIKDKVICDIGICLMEGEIIDIYETEELKYLISYLNGDDTILIREKDIKGYTEGYRKHLQQELEKILNIYSKKDILIALGVDKEHIYNI